MAGAWRSVRRAIAIGAGSGIGSSSGADMQMMHAGVNEERSGNQRIEVIVMTRRVVLDDGGQRMCANTCPTAIHIQANRPASTQRTSDNGRPMTMIRMEMDPLSDKKKARCANTGLSRKVSLVVFVGIRSDNRQTA